MVLKRSFPRLNPRHGSLPFPPPGIGDDGDDESGYGFDRLGRAALGESGSEGGDDEDAEKTPDDRSASAHETGAADDDGGDGGELETDPGVGIDRSDGKCGTEARSFALLRFSPEDLFQIRPEAGRKKLLVRSEAFVPVDRGGVPEG